MPHLIQMALFGAVVCIIASTALAAAPGFQSGRKGLWSRFVFCFWRYSLPMWVTIEFAVWLVTGRPYP